MWCASACCIVCASFILCRRSIRLDKKKPQGTSHSAAQERFTCCSRIGHKTTINMFLENGRHLNRSLISKPTPHPAEPTVHSSRPWKSEFPRERPTTFAICNSVTVPSTIIEWKLQYAVYWPRGLFSVSLKSHNESAVQHPPEHMSCLCFHAHSAPLHAGVGSKC